MEQNLWSRSLAINKTWAPEIGFFERTNVQKDLRNFVGRCNPRLEVSNNCVE